MRVIALKKLREFWLQHHHAEQPLKAWYAEAKKARWSNPQSIKERYRTASFIGNDRVVFNIAGNHYRLVVAIRYDFGLVYVRFVGTHKEYDKIDVRRV